ncbi:uncharacterized protein PAC_04109 [Phialocephala subalpina]|uniref:C2H2-type domain-containing protein n=1 Tax=Phialocephala subalpina TaxID=576137 RepID=A0A1L7WN85_9HELO|nr:uncharacterized protein PAC_04109 [Phialocephala subalpina]
MSDNIEYAVQDSYGDDLFDFEAASGEYDEAVPSNNTPQALEMDNAEWKEKWDEFSMAEYHTALPTSSFEAYEHPTGGSVWTERAPTSMFHEQQPTSSIAATYNSPEESDIWNSDPSNFQHHGFSSGSGASTEPQNHLPFDQAVPGPRWPDDQQPQNSGVVDWALPAEGNQSELPRERLPREVEHDRSTASGRGIRCPWPSCEDNSTLFHDEDKATVHFQQHQYTLLQSWSGPINCSWPNCSSKVFKEKYILNRHLSNIHVTPLRCTVVGCTHPEPFGKQSDLNRHIKNIHENLRVFCPVESCELSIIGFARKYTLDKHVREKHDNVRCPFNHCGAAILDGEQESHFQNSHGDYECALMACERGLRSHFTWDAARLHLTNKHNVYRYTADWAVSPWGHDHIIRKNPGRKPLAECQDCLNSSEAR